METVTGAEFASDVRAALAAARESPVVITEDGAPAYLLVSIEHYRRMQPSGAAALVERLRMDDDCDLPFDPIELSLQTPLA